MTALAITDECYRCGYDLRGISDDQPCPECGLLAERSRRTTDELHNSRPKWLRRISRGVWLILLAILFGWGWQVSLVALEGEIYSWMYSPRSVFAPSPWFYLLINTLPLFGIDVATVLILAGAILLTVREGYPLADREDSARRMMLRIAATVPLLVQLVQQALLFLRNGVMNYRFMESFWIFPVVMTLGSVPLTLLLFLQLRSLAKRARSAHLAEHCAIVGIGASAALIYLAIVMVLSEFAYSWVWNSKSEVSLMLMLAAGCAAGLFLLWALYLLTRFAIAFHMAARELQRKWKRDDRAVAVGA